MRGQLLLLLPVELLVVVLLLLSPDIGLLWNRLLHPEAVKDGYLCLGCGLRLRRTRNGWEHPGGSLGIKRCDDCGYYSDDLREYHQSMCPQCGSSWRMEHRSKPLKP
jgi:hypothetical protein